VRDVRQLLGEDTMVGQRLSGGCLCGAIRYEAAIYGRAVICHCQMCRRATGAAFATGVCIRLPDFRPITGDPVWRRSSATCVRARCRDCGSALFMKYDADGEIAVSIGPLDDVADIETNYSIWTSERLPFALGVDSPSSIPRGSHVVTRA
jgi:hypothetical protein